VIQGQPAHDGVVRPDLEPVVDAADVGEQVTVEEHDRLGCRRASGRALDHPGGIGPRVGEALVRGVGVELGHVHDVPQAPLARDGRHRLADPGIGDDEGRARDTDDVA